MKIVGDGKTTKIFRNDGTEIFSLSEGELTNLRSVWKYIAELTERIEKLEKSKAR